MAKSGGVSAPRGPWDPPQGAPSDARQRLAAAPSRFEPTAQAAWSRLRAARVHDYPRTRNHLQGAVTRLSPYLTHGFLGLQEALRDLRLRHGLDLRHKLIQELGWRAYFRHAWSHLGERVFEPLHEGVAPHGAYARELPADVREGRTGVAVVDRAVRELYDTGYLHNHARLWLASYVVHQRKAYWRCAADWMWSHLLDGDLASNHLSWQWVAGTASRKPYLFDAANVARYAGPAWHSPGTVIDAGYDVLDRRARTGGDCGAEPGMHAGVAEPPVHGVVPRDAGFAPAQADALTGRDVWVVHPWCLRDVPPGLLAVAVLDRDFHARWPWSALRWDWVLRRMRGIATLRWSGSSAQLAAALRGARSLHGVADPHLPWLQRDCGLAMPPSGLDEPGRYCASFSAWWSRLRGFAPSAAPDNQECSTWRTQ